MFSPFVGAEDSDSRHEPVATPQSTMARVIKLRDNYDALKTDLLEEINLVDLRMIKPAMAAKDNIQPMKKIIKNRENKKVRAPDRRRILWLRALNSLIMKDIRVEWIVVGKKPNGQTETTPH